MAEFPQKPHIEMTTEVKDKITNIVDVGGVTFTGVKTVSRSDGNTERSSTVSAGTGGLGVSGGNLGVGIAVDSRGFVTFSANFDASKQITGETYTAGFGVSISGNNKGSNSTTSTTVSFTGSRTSNGDTYSSTLKLRAPW